MTTPAKHLTGEVAASGRPTPRFFNHGNPYPVANESEPLGEPGAFKMVGC